MFLLNRPSAAEIAAFLRQAPAQPLSYGPIGLVHNNVGGWRLDEASAAVGRGADDFARAVAALRAWAHFDLGWLELHPRDASIAPGTDVAILIRHLGFWSLNGCRVVYQVGDGGTRFGYAYGTLTT